ncbi:response regulator [Spectribacter hydrogenooxidans]|uniref:Response regulator n=1 Tax=Spectribacter hydrogenoxidans TaxID=3075608 RepID=A0ABU3C2U5_9GAMM|nr:response regulator [Salinisphaera sp. W335]MDT0635880.1 response regulator [Salinisphaera sp. W335]
MPSILVVEDDASLRHGLERALTQAKYETVSVADAGEARAALATHDFAGVVLDLSLPDQDGLALLKGIRREGYTVPVVILTARDALDARVDGLDAGADDYVLKPFALQELLARLRAAMRRGAGQASGRLTHGDLELNTEAWQAWFKGRPLDLSRRQFALLAELLRHEGRVLTYDHLEASVYGWNSDIESNAIQVHVHSLRRKLPADLIKTVRGVGYMVPA